MHKGTKNACKNGCKELNTHVKSCLEIFLLALMFSTETLALSGVGGGRSAKSRNNNGVQAINAYICANLDCSSSNIKIVEKCANKAHMEHGICMCDDGCIGDGITCRDQTCPAGQIPNADNSACVNCEANQSCTTCTNTTLPNGDGNGNCVCSSISCRTGNYCEDGVCKTCSIPTKSCKITENVIDLITQCITTIPMTCGDNTYCDMDGSCQFCGTPATSCSISIDEKDVNNCITTKKIDCGATSYCNASGVCQCPDNATCSGGTFTCKNGYHPDGETCMANTCEGWTITSTITGCSSETTCQTPDTTYYKCTSCADGYTKSGDGCEEITCSDTVGVSCGQNSDCCSGLYCKMTSVTAGSCETLTEGTTYTGYTYRLGPSLNYWSAKNWCLAHNQYLVELPSTCSSSDVCLAFNWTKTINTFIGIASAFAAGEPSGKSYSFSEMNSKLASIATAFSTKTTSKYVEDYWGNSAFWLHLQCDKKVCDYAYIYNHSSYKNSTHLALCEGCSENHLELCETK